jgi:hypothetical protein
MRFTQRKVGIGTSFPAEGATFRRLPSDILHVNRLRLHLLRFAQIVGDKLSEILGNLLKALKCEGRAATSKQVLSKHARSLARGKSNAEPPSPQNLELARSDSPARGRFIP